MRAGVGKTAIAEGLAQRIVRGDIPDNLRGTRIVALDVGALVAGTKFRGEFEERIKAVLKEVKEATNVILFIDEIHLVMGAGKTDGAMDAANLLKPMLARGELRCIGATTLSEYRQHMERDAAFERRFQQASETALQGLHECAASGGCRLTTLIIRAAWCHLCATWQRQPTSGMQLSLIPHAVLPCSMTLCQLMRLLGTVQIVVGEPSVADTISILRGLSEKYASFHGVRVADRALVVAAELSARYIQSRFLPDKAIDLVDEACSNMRVQLESMPEEMDMMQRQQYRLQVEEAALSKEKDKVCPAMMLLNAGWKLLKRASMVIMVSSICLHYQA